MSNEAWIGLAAILVTLSLAGASAVFGIVGWFLSRMLADKDKALAEMEREIEGLQRANIRLGHQMTVIETVLTERGFLIPKAIRFPSQSPPNIGGTSE